jgi:uncharacterized integral membrane protein
MKNIGTIALLIGTIVVFIIGLSNTAAVAFSIFGAAVSLPEGVLLIAGYLVGVGLTFTLLLSRYNAKTASNARLQQWDKQDEKLLQQVQTDREKQLEAKIATLEAALQRALKK